MHGRLRGRFGQDMVIGWQRCARYGGDNLETEPPLDEAFETFRLRFYDGTSLRRETEVSGREWVYPVSLQTVDFSNGVTGQARLEIAQKSTTSQYGPALEIGLGG